jgi:N-methylhydantoinase A/acetophenone carboxylase
VTPYTIDVDIGGTFTDGYLTRGDAVRRVKVFTTPHDLTAGFVDCLREGAAAFGVDEGALLQDASVVRLSTTIGTNTFVQRRGPRLGAIVSRGAEASLYRADGRRVVPPDLLDPEMVRGVGGGSADEVLEAVRDLLNGGARIIVIALRGAGEDASAERAARALIRDRHPEHYLKNVPVQIASEVAEIPEDDLRCNTALLNGYLHREMARTLYRAEDWLRAGGFGRPLRIVHASGGVARVAKTKAIHTYSSGPTAALVGAQFIANCYGLQAAVGADMGGTTLDIGLMGREALPFNLTPTVAGIPIGVPMIETLSIGAGGGSIASVRPDGSLGVGPASAGAVPGPACYGKGGAEATVTDADVVLGYVDPEYFLAGRFRLFPDQAKAAVRNRVAGPLGVGLEEAAHRIVETVDRGVGETIASLVLDRGWNPREYVLFAYGGAGPAHAAGFAAAAGIGTVMVFPFSAVFSAFGMSRMDVNHVYTRSRRLVLFDPRSGAYLEDVDAFNGVVREMVARALTDMRGEGFGRPDEIAYSLDLVVRGEGAPGKVMVSSPRLGLEGPADARALCERFRKQANWAEGRGRELLETFILRSTAPTPHPPLPVFPTEGADPSAARKASRAICWSLREGFRETAVYALDRLVPGNRVAGPALVEAEDTVCPVPASAVFTMDQYRTGVLHLEPNKQLTS